jgi:hypothetical protein
VDLSESIAMDDPLQIPKLIEYGDKMGNMILNDQMDGAIADQPATMPAHAGTPS